MNETDARMQPYPKECGLGNPVPVRPAPDPATELIRELRDALKECYELYLSSNAQGYYTEILARATDHLERGAEKEGV